MTRTELRERAVYIAVALLLAATIGIDAVTPLGYSVWCLYFLAVGLTLFQPHRALPFVIAAASTVLLVVGFELSPPGGDPAISVVNRSIGGSSFWLMAFVVSQALRARREAGDMLWLQQGESELAVALWGEQTLESLAAIAVRGLCARLGAQVGAIYRIDGERLRLAGGVALDEAVPRELPRQHGQLGEILQQGKARRIAELSPDHLPMSSSLGRSHAGELLLAPLSANGVPVGALELGRSGKAGRIDLELDLLERAGEIIGVALLTTEMHRRQQELLEETRRQSEELQTQQEELRVANEELEEQTRALQHSQASLETQQAELEQTNIQLEERTQELEAQKQALLKSQTELLRNARAIEAASRYKSEFLANMSHELRTPLNSALILAKLLADNRDGNLSEEQVKYAQAIHASNNDLLVLINDILDLAKIEAGRVELADDAIVVPGLLQRLRDTFEPLARQKGLVFSAALAADAPTQMTGDTQRLLQILKNLAANALKFTDAGEVSVRVEAAGPARIRFVVCDTGIGIAEDQREVIFEAFRQADGSTSRKFGGTGLGLSISRDLARRMGGEITVRSEPGRGSCFTLELPLVATVEVESVPSPTMRAQPSMAAPATTGRPTPSAMPAAIQPADSEGPALPPPFVPDDRDALNRPGRLILAVEDDSKFAATLVRLAHDLDFDCVVAGTAEDALQMARACLPNGILLDISLPDVSGLSVLERLKRDPQTRHIPVHVVSAVERMQVALELGAVGYALKPATREMLVEAIGQLEERHRRSMRRLLIVEDDRQLRENLTLLLARDGLEIVAAGSVDEALEHLSHTTFDCMVTDLGLPDGSGYDLLEKLTASDARSFPPVIVYTGRSLSRDEEQRLRRYSRSIIIKGARSPERLLDEVTLFLHSVEASLPSDQQRLLAQARKRDAMLDGRTFLLAEDDVRNIFALSSVLEPLGVRLEIARNGREALERLEQRDVDLVLMDIMMPEMDGLTAMRLIRARPAWAQLPIIALTAKAMADDRENCLRAGANDYIAKPIDVDKLVSLCRVWCPK